MLRKIILLLLISVLAYLMGSYFWSKWTYLLAHVERFSGVAIGGVLFVGLWGLRHRFTIIQNWLTYFGTRVHESAHEKMAFLSGRRLFGEYSGKTLPPITEKILPLIPLKVSQLWIS